MQQRISPPKIIKSRKTFLGKKWTAYPPFLNLENLKIKFAKKKTPGYIDSGFPSSEPRKCKNQNGAKGSREKWTALSPFLNPKLHNKIAETSCWDKMDSIFPSFESKPGNYKNQNAAKSSWEKMDSISPFFTPETINIKLQKKVPGKKWTAFPPLLNLEHRKIKLQKKKFLEKLDSIFPSSEPRKLTKNAAKSSREKWTAFSPFWHPEIVSIKLPKKLENGQHFPLLSNPEITSIKLQ